MKTKYLILGEKICTLLKRFGLLVIIFYFGVKIYFYFNPIHVIL